MSKDEENYTSCDINVATSWRELHNVEINSIQSFTVASFDIECTSGDGTFPQASRDDDKVIQIGTTFNRYGEDECYYKHIVTLGSCDPIDGVDVESYETEVELLMAWVKLIQNTNPDIHTGYNIFGFDYKYLFNRAKFGLY